MLLNSKTPYEESAGTNSSGEDTGAAARKLGEKGFNYGMPPSGDNHYSSMAQAQYSQATESAYADSVPAPIGREDGNM